MNRIDKLNDLCRNASPESADEAMEILPWCHDWIQQSCKVVALLSSMVSGSEEHSDISNKMVNDLYDELEEK